MLKRYYLEDYQWDKIKDYLPGKKSDPGKTGSNNKDFIEAVMWIGKTGAPWRDLPLEYGNLGDRSQKIYEMG